ncbi:MAG: DMT family transporter, partial [Prevotellaceae bacterium]|nr:DMT family transporter [Prevotellaceae bacterium]
KVLGVFLGISGAALLILHANGKNGGSDNMLGIIFAFINITCYSAYLIITRTISQKYSAITLMKWMFLFTSIMLLPFGAGKLPEQRIYSSEITTTAFLELAFILVCSTTIAYFLLPIALKRLRATTVSIYMNLQPIIASAVAIFIGQDIFTWDKPLAAVLVIAGAYIVTQSVSRKDIEKAEGYKEAGG